MVSSHPPKHEVKLFKAYKVATFTWCRLFKTECYQLQGFGPKEFLMTRTEAYGEFVSLWRVYKKDPTEENRIAADAAYEKYLEIDTN